MAISEAYVLFIRASDITYSADLVFFKTYYDSIVHAFILYALFGINNFLPYFLDKKQKLCYKTLEKIDISEKFRKSSRNLEQILEKFWNFNENFQKEI